MDVWHQTIQKSLLIKKQLRSPLDVTAPSTGRSAVNG